MWGSRRRRKRSGTASGSWGLRRLRCLRCLRLCLCFPEAGNLKPCDNFKLEWTRRQFRALSPSSSSIGAEGDSADFLLPRRDGRLVSSGGPRAVESDNRFEGDSLSPGAVGVLLLKQ